MVQRKLSITTVSVLLLVLLLSACQPIQPVANSVAQAAEDEERLFFTFMVANSLDTNNNHWMVLEGHGTFNPNNLDVEGGGVFQMFDDTAEAPKPMVDLGVGSWQAKRGVAFTSPGSYMAATAGVFDMVVELTPDDGEPVEATLRVICNVPQNALFNKAEDGSGLPEGVFLTVPEVGTYEPVISEGGPPWGLTLIGPVNELRLKRKAENQ